MPRNALKFFAILVIFAGLVWILQGLNILLGSYMSGNPQWIINGIITVLIGAVIFWFANRNQ